jgi:hypothetical protein
MSNGREFDKPGTYEVRIRGTLDEGWSDRFEGLAILPQAENTTLLVGTVTDQVALHGLLSTLRDLGLPLLSVLRVDAGEDACGTQDSEWVAGGTTPRSKDDEA